MTKLFQYARAALDVKSRDQGFARFGVKPPYAQKFEAIGTSANWFSEYGRSTRDRTSRIKDGVSQKSQDLMQRA
jgi:hypothetical protein